jgi:acetoin utilization deacetylase AcuC-like enzyme
MLLYQVNLDDDDFYWVQSEIAAVARDVCDGRIVSVLEGGYDLDAIARAATLCVKAQVEAGSAANDAAVNKLAESYYTPPSPPRPDSDATDVYTEELEEKLAQLKMEPGALAARETLDPAEAK